MMTTSQSRAARRNAAVLGATAATVGLLFLYPTSTNRGGDQHRPGQALATPGVVAPTSPGNKAPAGSSGSATTVVNGTSVDTRYGPVQVQLHVRGGRIVSATAIDYPQGSGRDRQINGLAIPVLQQETVAAQSARIDTVSGATFTSDGYRTSLQAALDAAHL
jgi:uncharacterized protein with FMN-binding domain